MEFRVIDGCPCPKSIAPYISVVLREARMVAESIYRGQDAAPILHHHGKHTQAEVHELLPAISNPAGRSQHELRSDGVGNPGPIGRHLHEWEVGVDSGGNDPLSRARVEAAARKHGWEVRHPYSRGAEGHHWCFAREPKPRSRRQRARLILIRATLARR